MERLFLVLVMVLLGPEVAQAQRRWTEMTPPASVAGAVAEWRADLLGCGVWDGELYVVRPGDILAAGAASSRRPAWRMAYQSPDELRSISIHPTLGAFVIAEERVLLHAGPTGWTVELEHVNPASGQAPNQPANFDAPFVDAEGSLIVSTFNGPAFRRRDDGTWEVHSHREMLAIASAWGPLPCGRLWSAFGDTTPSRTCSDYEMDEYWGHAVSAGRWTRLPLPVELGNENIEIGYLSPTLMTSFLDLDGRRRHLWHRREGEWEEIPGPSDLQIATACMDGRTLYAMVGQRVFRTVL